MKFTCYVYVYAGIYGCGSGGHAYKEWAYGSGGGKRRCDIACKEYWLLVNQIIISFCFC